MLKRILVPTDGSPMSMKAVDIALEYAKAFDADVLALHVHPTFHGPYGADESTQADLREMDELRGRSHAEALFSQIRKRSEVAGVPLTAEFVVSDVVWKEIIAIARSRKCDLIYMGSHGHRGFRALMLGSETQKVLSYSKVPVLVLH